MASSTMFSRYNMIFISSSSCIRSLVLNI
uniref:Uncharacterized protein n=1 Tax=Arundo donax TaxID=35708 RepID=A0A0A9AWG3_ARUDO